MSINTTKNDIEIPIEPQELFLYEYADMTDTEAENGSNNTEKRTQLILNKMKLYYLNVEERRYVEKLVRLGKDRFLLPGDKLPVTAWVKHYIPTIGEKPVKCGQCRQPQEHEELGNN